MQLRELYERHSQKALCEATLVCGNSRAMLDSTRACSQNKPCK